MRSPLLRSKPDQKLQRILRSRHVCWLRGNAFSPSVRLLCVATHVPRTSSNDQFNNEHATQSTGTFQAFHSSHCRSRRSDFPLQLPAGVALLPLLMLVSLLAFQLSEISFWYSIVGGVSLAACFFLGWRYRKSLRCLLRCKPDYDSRKLYNSHNA